MLAVAAAVALLAMLLTSALAGDASLRIGVPVVDTVADFLGNLVDNDIGAVEGNTAPINTEETTSKLSGVESSSSSRNFEDLEFCRFRSFWIPAESCPALARACASSRAGPRLRPSPLLDTRNGVAAGGGSTTGAAPTIVREPSSTDTKVDGRNIIVAGKYVGNECLKSIV